MAPAGTPPPLTATGREALPAMPRNQAEEAGARVVHAAFADGACTDCHSRTRAT